MTGQPGGLVDHHQVLVLVSNANLYVFVRPSLRAHVLLRELDGVSLHHQLALVRTATIATNHATLEHALGLRTGERQPVTQNAVQTCASLIGSNLKSLQATPSVLLGAP